MNLPGLFTKCFRSIPSSSGEPLNCAHPRSRYITASALTASRVIGVLNSSVYFKNNPTILEHCVRKERIIAAMPEKVEMPSAHDGPSSAATNSEQASQACQRSILLSHELLSCAAAGLQLHIQVTASLNRGSLREVNGAFPQAYVLLG